MRGKRLNNNLFYFVFVFDKSLYLQTFLGSDQPSCMGYGEDTKATFF